METQQIDLDQISGLATKIFALKQELEKLCQRTGMKVVTGYTNGVPRKNLIKCRPAESQAPTEGEGPCESTEPELPEECAEFKTRLEGYIRVFKEAGCSDEDAFPYALEKLGVKHGYW